MRYAVVLSFLLIATAVGVLGYHEYLAGPPVVLAAPAQLHVQAQGASLTPDGWTNAGSVLLSVTGGTASTAEVEVRPYLQGFDDSATIKAQAGGRVATTSRTVGTGDTAQASVHLTNGIYHWQARWHNGQGVSPWVQYHGVIRIDTTPPAVTQLTSPTDPVATRTYHSSTMTFDWKAQDGASGIEGYSYRLDHDPKATPAADIRTNLTTVTLKGLGTGLWYFHVRSLDRAGNWSTTRTFPVKVDVTPPGLTRVTFNRFTLDPLYQPLTVSFAVTKPTRTLRVGVYDQNSGKLERLYELHNVTPGQATSVTWDGKNSAGAYVPAGSYSVYIRAIDPYGFASVAGWRDFVLNYQRIVVSLSQQKLWAYNGNHLFLSSLVTTGNKALPTPTGTFSILGKFHPFTFRSPWPKSSPYYYPPSPTQWAMLFRAGGYFIHDAPWRSVFGPGSNAATGTPGQNYTGTHGCVNVPTNVAQQLFAWASIGTIVQVVN